MVLTAIFMTSNCWEAFTTMMFSHACWDRRNQAPFTYFFGRRMGTPDEQLVQRPERYPLWHVVTIPSIGFSKIGKLISNAVVSLPMLWNTNTPMDLSWSFIVIHSRPLRLVKTSCMLALPFPASASFITSWKKYEKINLTRRIGQNTLLIQVFQTAWRSIESIADWGLASDVGTGPSQSVENVDAYQSNQLPKV